MIQIDFEHLIAIAGIPSLIASAVIGFCVWLLQRKISKNEDKRKAERAEEEAARNKREKNREDLMSMLVKGNNAAIAVAEATAKAVQRIPEAHCNGDMHAALEYAAKVKHEQKDFLTEKGIQSILD